MAGGPPRFPNPHYLPNSGSGVESHSPTACQCATASIHDDTPLYPGYPRGPPENPPARTWSFVSPDSLRPERSPAQGTSTHGDSAEARLGRPRIHRRGLLQPYHVALTAAPTERPCRTVPCGQPSSRPGPIPLQVPASFYCIRSTH